MHVWLDLIVREVLFVALLAALGAGPAAFLGAQFDATARLAMAPVLGLCVGSCLTVTLGYEYPARQTSWLLMGVAALSVAIAAWRRPVRRLAPNPAGRLQVAIILIVVLGAFDYPLAARHTVGPVGGYDVADTSGYVTETDGLARESVRDAQHSVGPYSDLETVAVVNYDGHASQQLDISALEANCNSLLGLGATDTQSPFLIAVLLTGALGAFAVVRSADQRAGWAGVLAGCLFAGPAFVQLLMNGSQAAIAGAAVLAPAVALGVEALRRGRVADLILLGLAAAGLQTLYPLFVPCFVVGAAVTLGVVAMRCALAGQLSARRALRAVDGLGLVLACSIVLTPVAFSRNLSYWGGILNGTFSFVGLPLRRLPALGVPGWLLQTRDFFDLADPLRHSTAGNVILGMAVPLVLLGVIATGSWRHHVVLAMLTVAAAASVFAWYTWSHDSCSYCVGRNLIPVAALMPSGLALGLAALALVRPSGGGRLTMAVVAVAAIAILAVGHEAIVLRQRMSQGDYMLDSGDRQALAALAPGAGPVELEGFSESPQAPMELPLVYDLTDETTHGDLSLPTEVNDNDGLAYLTAGAVPLGRWFKANYQYVLTRLAGVATQRRTIARFGSIALERRTQPLDVTLVSGASVPTARLDPSGTAWVNPALPLQFLVVGGVTDSPAWVTLRLRATGAVGVARGTDVVWHRQTGDDVRICLRAVGQAPVRSAAVQTSFTPQPPPAPPGRFDLTLPPPGLTLQSMGVSDRSCGRP
jgi:hypothetical protein